MNLPPYIKNINKKSLVLIAIALVLGGILIGYTIYKNMFENTVSPTESLELELREAIESNIENWDAYEKVTDAEYKKFGNDDACPSSVKGDADFMSYVSQAEKGDAYTLDFGYGAYLTYTPNYNNWSQEKLSSFGINDMRICSAGWLIPLHAYPDKILWGNITCSTGAENPNINICLKITQTIMGYFATKTN